MAYNLQVSNQSFHKMNNLNNSVKFTKSLLHEKINPWQSHNHHNFQNSSSQNFYNTQAHYQTNYQTNPNYAYVFKERVGKLNWKDILRIDIDTLIRNNDIAPLEEFLENLVFANIEDNDMHFIPEGFVTKLLRTYQYIIEYLMFTQQKVEFENKNIETQYNTLINEAFTKEEKMKENKNKINILKKETKQKEVVMNTYKFLLEDYRKNNVVDKKEYFYCKYCEGKKFSTQEKVDDHIQRRHALQISQEMLLKNALNHTQDNDMMNLLLNEVQIEKKIDGLKSYMETYMSNMHNHDEISKLAEGQKTLEEKLRTFSSIPTSNPDLERQIQEMKEMIKNSKRDTRDQDEFDRSLKRMKEDNDEKMKIFTEQINLLRMSLHDELQRLKEKKKEQPIVQTLQTVNNLTFTPKKKEPEPKQVTPPPKVKTPPKTPPKEKTPPKPVKEVTPPRKLKKLFNAGDIESDHSIEEPPRVKTPPKPIKVIEPKAITPPKPIVEEKRLEPPQKAAEEVVVEKIVEAVNVQGNEPVKEVLLPPADKDMLNKVARSIMVRDEKFEKSQEKDIHKFKQVKLPERKNEDKTKEIEQIMNDRLKNFGKKVGMNNLNDKKSLIEVVKEIKGDMHKKSHVSTKESIYVRPLMDKLDLEKDLNFADTIANHSPRKGKDDTSILRNPTKKQTDPKMSKEDYEKAEIKKPEETKEEIKLKEDKKKKILGNEDDAILGA